MKDTLNQMGIKFNDVSEDRIEIGRSYHPIAINSTTGEISYDNMQESEVDNIKREYTVNYYREKAIREGMNLQVDRKENGEIVLNVTHS
jgi:hypothetical protein